jgi:hypothetical protein
MCLCSFRSQKDLIAIQIEKVCRFFAIPWKWTTPHYNYFEKLIQKNSFYLINHYKD